MALPPYLVSLGLSLLVGIGIGLFLRNQNTHKPQSYGRKKSNVHIEPGYDRPRSPNNSWTVYPTCSICLESVTTDDVPELRCDHKLHSHCFIKLRKRGYKSCPECRSSL